MHGATTRTSSVTVTATDDTVEVDDVTYTDGSGTTQELMCGNAAGGATPYSESTPEATGTGVDFSVQITVYSDGDLNNIDFARINIYSQNQDMGDALGEDAVDFYNEWDNTADGWTGESETLTIDLTTDDTDTFLRYGDWTIHSEIEASDGTILDSETFNTDILSVEEHTSFNGLADLSATIDPGQSVGINTGTTPDVTFTIGTGGTGNAQVSVITNYAWGLAISDTTLTSTDSPDEIAHDTAGYSNEGGSPTA